MPLPCPPSLEDKGLISALTTKSGLNAYVLDFRGHSKVMHSYETFELKRERKILTCNIFFSIISFSINYICKDKGLIFVVHTLELVSKELNHFGVIAGLFRQIGCHNSRFVLFWSF